MKTIITTLPIYKNRASQNWERSKANGSALFAPIWCPRYRLPSFQWLDDTDAADHIDKIEMIDVDDASIDITGYFATLPIHYDITGDVYFMYNGDTLKYPLSCGNYYLKITVNTNHVYFSDWFRVDLIYDHVHESFTNTTFDTLTQSGREIVSCIDAGAGAYADSTKSFEVFLGQEINVVVWVTNTGATLPNFTVYSSALGAISNVVTTVAGLNTLILTTTRAASDCRIRMSTTGTCNFSTDEILIFNNFCLDHVIISFSSCCNLGDIYYENQFIQALWLESDNMEQTFPYVEKGQDNGDGRFVPTFRRQDKIHSIKTKLLPQYMVDVLHRLKMHDLVSLIDQLGNEYTVEDVDVEHEWQFDDKYYATANVLFDLDEAFIAGACCTT